jgi:hypothetical protein
MYMNYINTQVRLLVILVVKLFYADKNKMKQQ